MNWYCIHTKPLKENQVLGYFRDRLNLETYFPQLKHQRTLRRVLRTIVSPLFPRYLFCRLDLNAQYRAVRYAPDVIDIVSFGAQPAMVGDMIVAELKSWAGEVVDFSLPQRRLQTGDRVEITDGPMRGLSAVILHERNDRERVAVLLSTLQCSAQLVLGRSQLAPAESTKLYFPPMMRQHQALAS